MASLQMFAQDHEETFPSLQTVWKDISVDPGILICPTAGKSLQLAYVYDFPRCASTTLGSLADPTTTWVTADADSNGLVAYRHSNNAIASYADGHVGTAGSTINGILNVQFQGYNPGSDLSPGPIMTGAAAIGSGYWNGLTIAANTVTSITGNSLKLSSGYATPLSVNVSCSNDGTKILASDWIRPAEGNQTNIPLLDAYLAFNSSGADSAKSCAFNIDGLVSNNTYDMYFYGTPAKWTGNSTKVTIAGTSKTLPSGWSGSYVENTNYLRFSGLTAPISGTLAPGGSNYAIFNGFQLAGTFSIDLMPKDLINLNLMGYNTSDGDTAPTSNPNNGAAVLGNTGDFWNYISANDSKVSNISKTNMKMADGKRVSTVGFSATENANGGSSTFRADCIRASEGTWGNALWQNYLFINSTEPAATTISFTLNGLASGYGYNLYFYCQAGGYNGQSSTVTINGVTKSAVSTGGTGFRQGDNYVAFTGIPAGSDGTITGTLGHPAGGIAILNGLQISGPFATTQ